MSDETGRAPQVVVLAGGLATRLGQLAQSTPKYLLPLAGRPFAHHQLARLAACGIQDVVLCIGHLGDAIEAALGDGSRFGVRLRYSHEGEARLGTAGALRAALGLLATSFVVTYGDSYLPFDYAAPWRVLQAAPYALGCMAVYANAGRYDRSNVALSSSVPNTAPLDAISFNTTHTNAAQPHATRPNAAQPDATSTGATRPNAAQPDAEQRNAPAQPLWVARYDKGLDDPALDHIDYGATALRREAIARLPEGPADLAPLLSRLARRKQLLAHRATERFYEIGSPAGYAELDALLSRGLDAPPPSGQEAL